MSSPSPMTEPPPTVPDVPVSGYTSHARPNPFKSLLAMVLCAGAVFLILPFTQYISSAGTDTTEIQTVEVSLPPPPAPPPPEPPPEQEPPQEPPPELQRTPPPMSLGQLDLALNPGIGDAVAGSFALDSFGVTPDAASELDIFDIADLDRPPRRVRSVAPVYPVALRNAGIEGEVALALVVDEYGNAKVDHVISATDRDFVAPAIAAVEQCKWEPPMKDGKAVRVRYAMRVPFTIR